MNIEYYDIKTLVPYDKNPRNNKEAVDKVAESIKEFGFKNPIIVDGDNVLIAGHTRYLAAKKLKLKEVPVIKVTDLSPEQVKAFRITDNKTSEFAAWDYGLLAQEFDDLKGSGFDLLLTAFDETEINAIMDDNEIITSDIVEDDFDMNETLSQPEPIAKEGNIWQLGKHKLMCGDSTSHKDLALLMDGAKADMVFTDPPYNIAYEGKTEDALTIQNDSMSDGDFYKFLYDVYETMLDATKEGGAIYVCHADTEGINFRQALKDSGWLLKQTIIWAKNQLAMGRSDYQWKHEPILYGWKPGAAHCWYGGRKNTTVWQPGKTIDVKEVPGGFELIFDTGYDHVVVKVPKYEVVSEIDDSLTSVWYFDKPLRNAEHPTMKPIGIPARAIRNSSRYNDIVLDTFGGSGSTLMAAEQTGRQCRMMELDPIYCDVIVNRWEEFTGEKAVLLNGKGGAQG